MSDLIPFILSEKKSRIKDEINDKEIAVIFDSTSRLVKVAVIVLDFIDPDSWTPEQKLVCLQILARTMGGEEIAHKLITILSTELST